MFKKLSLTGLILLAVLGPIVGIKVLQIGSLIAMGKEQQAAGMPPTPVATYVANEQNWEEIIQTVGSLQAVQGVTLSAELGGTVVEIAVENGAAVAKDALLVRLDTSVEEAQLAASEANLTLARLQLDRSRSLLGQNTISRAEFDAAEATAKAAEAEVAHIRAQIARKTIRAPFAGRVGIRMINLGQTISPGAQLLPLQSLDPIFIDFTVPQQRIASLAVGQSLRVKVDGLDAPFEGKVTAINPEVDALTRNVRVQGTLANADEKLRPGMFAEVTLVQASVRKVVAVPATAVMHAPFGDSVYVVEEQEGRLVARQQFVRLGDARGDFIAIVDGISAGARVVSAGAFKLRNNSPVVIDDTMQPEAKLAPSPRNT
ncbi:MAG: efflux RND transporter periplasmic adaptor subunit [Opitutaceae bacterium]|jgi:membrane fusion protein (multidrug efflux system)|nr:efflux RND transporter periplasmic adaptor subunit [Opitutaceae bacterium]